MAFSLDAVTFDGVNDWLNRGAELTGVADGSQGSISLWIKIDPSIDALTSFLFNSNTFDFSIQKRDTGELFVFLHSGVGEAFDFKSSASYSSASGWINVLASWDTNFGAGSRLKHLYVNDVSDSLIDLDVGAAFDVDYVGAAEWSIGQIVNKFAGDMAEFWFDTTYIDFSVSANRRKFITAAGKAVNLGADGSAPTGVTPKVYLHIDTGEAPDNFAINRGSGGGFTLTGSLATAATEPAAEPDAEQGMTTWNPADIGIAVALSNGNLTATKINSAIWRSGRSTTSKTTGKKYFECTADNLALAVNFAAIAVAESTADKETYFGRATSSIAYYADGSVYQNDLVIITLASYATGSTVGVAIDEDAGKGWFCDGAGSYGTGNPATGANPHFTFAAGTTYFGGFTVNDNLPADITTANFGATAFAHIVPSGFVAWDAPAPVVALELLGGKQGRIIREKEWHYVNAAEIKAARRRERERLAISEAQQRRIDKAARKIAKAEPSLPGGLLTPPAVQAMPAFGALLAALQPTEGMVAALVQAIMDRIEAMRFEAEEEDVIVNFLMEM